MQQFVVPQFIDVESKIIGPVTVRQFIIMLVAGLFMFISYKLSDFGLFILESVIILIVFGAVAFLKINGQPFHFFLLNFLQTFKKPRLRIWYRDISTEELRVRMKEAPKLDMEKEAVKKADEEVTVSKLSELSLIVNTGGAYQGQE